MSLQSTRPEADEEVNEWNNPANRSWRILNPDFSLLGCRLKSQAGISVFHLKEILLKSWEACGGGGEEDGARLSTSDEQTLL